MASPQWHKIKTLSRSATSAQAAGSTVSRLPRNLDPAQHPFERAREYTRALTAVKLERMFAAPFIGQLGRGHVEGVYTLSCDSESLARVASGSGDGVVKVWDLPGRKEVWSVKGHDNLVRDTCWTRDGRVLSCAVDRSVKLWDPYGGAGGTVPVATYLGSAPFTGLSFHGVLPCFAAATQNEVAVYDLERPSNTPVQSLKWPTSVDTVTGVAFNPVETSILASTATDRSIILYDLRTSSPLSKTTLALASNAIAWNPMEAFNFAVANEDHNVYIFDMRKIDRALNILKDHVAAVMDVQFSPTGEELVTASYDRTIRLWTRNQGHSRDVYHTKRMQRVFSCQFTPDSNYVLSGSDDGNVRLWRTHASQRQGVKPARQREKLEYDAALVERYKHMPEINRIKRHRRLPKAVKKAGEIKKEEIKAVKRRVENERKHSKKGLVKRRSEREKMILVNEQ